MKTNIQLVKELKQMTEVKDMYRGFYYESMAGWKKCKLGWFITLILWLLSLVWVLR